MKAKIWVMTYRRPERLKTCLASLEGTELPVVVLEPDDESNKVPDWVRVVKLPNEFSHIGAVGPRQYALEMASHEGDDAVIYLEDDSEMAKRSYGRFRDGEGESHPIDRVPGYVQPALLLEDLAKCPKLASVQNKHSFPPPKKPRLLPWLGYHNSVGGLHAMRVEAMVQAGGWDKRLLRLEDVDICMRMRVLGWELAQDLRVQVTLGGYLPGGTAATEAKGKKNREEAAIQTRISLAGIVEAKFPSGVVAVDKKRGWVRFRKGMLEQLQANYQAGKVAVSVEGVAPKEGKSSLSDRVVAYVRAHGGTKVDWKDFHQGVGASSSELGVALRRLLKAKVVVEEDQYVYALPSGEDSGIIPAKGKKAAPQVQDTPAPQVQEEEVPEVQPRTWGVEDVIASLKDVRVVTIDTETSSLHPWKEGKILIGFGVKGLHKQSYYMPCRHVSGEEDQFSLEDIGRVVEACRGKTIVFHNAKFDMAVMYQEGWDFTWEDVVCTMVMARLCTEDRMSYELEALVSDLIDVTGWEHKKTLKLLLRKNKWPTFAYVPIADMTPYSHRDLEHTEALYIYFRPIIISRGLDDLFALEKRVTRALFDMERHGFMLDKGYVREEKKRTAKLLKEFGGKLRDLCGEEVEYNSPQKVGAILSRLGVVPAAKTPTGKPSWSKASLAATDHPAAELVVMARAIDKIKGSYYDNFEEGWDDNFAIHANIYQSGAKTGRMSCRDPNLQNIPRFEGFTGARAGAIAEGLKMKKREEEKKRKKALASSGGREGDDDTGLAGEPHSEVEEELFGKVRGSFIPRPGHFLLFADWSQIELRIFASYAGEEDLLKIFDYGLDIHRMTALAAFGAMPEDKDSHEYKWFRNMGKQIAFGLIYGMGIKLLAIETGRSEDEAREFMNMYFARFRNGHKFIWEVRSRAKIRPLRNKYKRRRYVPPEKDYIGVNFLVQGTAADLMKDALARLWERIKAEGLRMQPLVPVHDEIIMEVPYEEAEVAIKIAREEMERSDVFKIPLKIDLEWSPTRWSEKTTLECGVCGGFGKVLNIGQDELLKAMYAEDRKTMDSVVVKGCKACKGTALDMSGLIKHREALVKAA